MKTINSLKLSELEKQDADYLFSSIANCFAIPDDITVSEWCSRNLYLSAETAALPGKYDPDTIPYTKEIINTFADDDIRKIVVKSSAQVGKTTVLFSLVAWAVVNTPGPMLFVGPTVELAEDYSITRFSPLFRDSPNLQGVLHEELKKKKTSNTIRRKNFDGGYIFFAGSNGESGLSGRPMKYVFADELGQWENLRALDLVEKRTTAFPDYKIIYTSTPGLDDDFISSEYERSDKRKFFVPCPKCNHFQLLQFKRLIFQKIINPVYPCEKCQYKISQEEKNIIVAAGRWQAEKPLQHTAGFWVNELYNPFVPWTKTIRSFLDAKEDKSGMRMREFNNLSLGESWSKSDIIIPYSELWRRRIKYASDIPEGVNVLVAGVDVQDDRLELEIVGYGQGGDCWGIDYIVLNGSPALEELWQKLEEILLKKYPHKNGEIMIACACIDSGGHFTQQVYQFVTKHRPRKWLAIKGSNKRGAGIIEKLGVMGGKKKQEQKYSSPLYFLGTDTAKEEIYAKLKIDEAGKGKCYFPKNNANYNEEYFKMLTSERIVMKRDSSGYVYQKWVKTYERNEAIDIRVYALAALTILNPDLKTPFLVNRNMTGESIFSVKQRVDLSDL